MQLLLSLLVEQPHLIDAVNVRGETVLHLAAAGGTLFNRGAANLISIQA